MASLQVLAAMVPGRLQVHGASRDPDDKHVLACAVEGEVDFVASDDRKHILPLREYRDIAIVSLPAFLQMLRWRQRLPSQPCWRGLSEALSRE